MATSVDPTYIVLLRKVGPREVKSLGQGHTAGSGCARVRKPRGANFPAAQPHPTLVPLGDQGRDEEAPAHPGLPSPHMLDIEDPRATNRASFQAGAGAELAASPASAWAEKPFCCGSHRSCSPPAHGKEWPASCPSTAAQIAWTPPCRSERRRAPALPRPPVLLWGAEAARLCFQT